MGNNTSRVVPFDSSDQDCPICMENMSTDQYYKPCVNCHAVYHEECIEKWFNTNLSCPMCQRFESLIFFIESPSKSCFNCLPIFCGIVVPN
jgi:hypothetical protein